MKRKNKPGIAAVLAAATAVALTGCSGMFTDFRPFRDGASSSEESSHTAGEITVEEALLFEQEGVRVTATDMEKGLLGTELHLLVENDTEKNIGVQCDTVVVNGYMMDHIFSCTVAAGKKANDSLTLNQDGLDAAGITAIGEIAIRFKVFDRDTYDSLFVTDEVAVRTSSYDTMEIQAADDGKELYNADGLRIVAKYVEDNTLSGTAVTMFIENMTAGDIIVQCEDLSVNGFMMMPVFSSRVNKGCMAIDDLILLSSELETNNIDKVTSVELKFKIVEADTYRTLHTSDAVQFAVGD